MTTQTISYSAIVARLLANYRQIKGLEQADMAARLGISPPSYSRVETGQTALTIDALFSIARVLDLNVPALMAEAQRVIAKVESEANSNLQMAPLTRSNTKGAEENPISTFVTGAALGALIAALLSK